MSNRITQALTKLFDKHRIVFWYDVKSELRGDYECLDLSGIEKIELTNNEFGIKYRVLREEPEQRFLRGRDSRCRRVLLARQPSPLPSRALDGFRGG